MTRKKHSTLLWILTFLSLLITIILDPDVQIIKLPWGATALTELASFTRPVTAVLLAFGLLRLLFGYSFDEIQNWTKKAMESPIGAGLIAIATAIFFLALSIFFVVITSMSAHADERSDVIPKNAPVIVAAFKDAQQKLWPDMQLRHVAMGQLEHESCVSLYSVRCMNYNAEFKGKRPDGTTEYGGGVIMATYTVSPTGVRKMDALAGMKVKYPRELAGLTWANLLTNPQGQMSFYVLMTRSNENMFSAVTDPAERRNFTLAAYNAGPAAVKKRRQICGLKAGCDPQKWQGHASTTCPLSAKPIYGKRSACDINNGYVADVLARSPKYQQFF